MRNRFLFLILLICFSCVRVGWDRWHRAESLATGPNERKLLIWGEENSADAGSSSTFPLETLTEVYDSSQTSGDEDEPLQSTTCKTEFDKTIGVALFTAGVLYCFVGLAIICEGEFKDSVVELARFLKLPPDVAGATLMAAGTSSPELFTSLVAIAGPVADIGTGTIVGSAIFNILIIIGSCVIFSSHIFHLSWKPVLRDTLVNLVSFAFLYIVFYDQYIYWYEAFLGCFLYLAYVGMMGFNTQVMQGMDWVAVKVVTLAPFLNRAGAENAAARHADDPHHVEGNVSESSTNLLADYEDRIPGGAQVELGDVAEDAADDEEAAEDKPRASLQEDADFEDSHEEKDHFPTSVWGWIWFVLAWPYELLFRYTIPPVKGRYKYQFIASFFLSLAWLAVFSTMMVKWTEEIGCVLGIEDAIMGVTFLAVGTSLPDCLTSIFVARTGRGNMAVCNALGSNVFDILLALSLPWVLSILLSGQPVSVHSETLNEDVIVLTGTVLVFFATMCINRWRLTKPIGAFFFVLYALFVTYTVLKEMGILSF